MTHSFHAIFTFYVVTRQTLRFSYKDGDVPVLVINLSHHFKGCRHCLKGGKCQLTFHVKIIKKELDNTLRLLVLEKKKSKKVSVL